MDIYFERREFTELATLAQSTLDLAPEDEKATAYLRATQKGNPLLQVALERVKTHRTPENLLELSLRYYEAGQFTKCIDAAEEALKLKSDYGPAYINICAAYNALKQWDRAIEAGEKAVRLNPNNPLAKNNLAWAKREKMKSEKAKVPTERSKLLQEVSTIGPWNSPQSSRRIIPPGIGRICHSIGRFRLRPHYCRERRQSQQLRPDIPGH